MSRMVKITNMINAQVSVVDPANNVNRQWKKRGQSTAIPYEAVEQLLYEDGFRNMIDSGILYIESMKDKQDLGLEDIDSTKPTNIIALSTADMERLLKETPLVVFKKEVANLPAVQVDSLIEYAVENKIANVEKCTFLKELTKKDVLKAISNREEIEKTNKR